MAFKDLFKDENDINEKSVVGFIICNHDIIRVCRFTYRVLRKRLSN